ncbi:MAG: TPM domain-containing protein [Syntrophotaleaceae bacterium]
MKFLFKVGLVLLFLLLPAACQNRPDAGVEDRAGLLSGGELRRLEDFREHLLRHLDIELKVLVLDESPVDFDREAVKLFDDYGLGLRTRAARGVLLVIDPEGGQVRMEIGYDLEGIFPDGFVGYIEDRQMTPFFQLGRVTNGIEATVELLVGRALGEIKVEELVGTEPVRPLKHLSGGGGARVAVEIGRGAPQKGRVADRSAFGAGTTPLETLQTYLKVLEGHVKDPDLGIYTPETRKFFRNWLVTDAQQDNELRELVEVMELGTTRISGNLAAIRFPTERKKVSPYLFRQGQEGWMLDFAAMSRLIGFDQNNQWFFRNREHAYQAVTENP